MSLQIQEVFMQSAAIIAAIMFLVWLASLWLHDASIVDLIWGIGFVLVAWTAYFLVRDREQTNLLLPILTAIWGLRLSWHLAWRNHGKPEDYRYQAMRSAWGNWFPWVSLLTVFGLQGVIMWTVSLPIQVGVAAPVHQFTWLSALGVTIWAIGLFFEVVGDWQLAKFKSDPEHSGSVLDVGLWRYTRHPNYFGDFLVWWGLYLVAMSQSTAWWTAVGPLVMSILLMRISGVTLLEKSLLERKPRYAEYVARTNAFFPGLPRS